MVPMPDFTLTQAQRRLQAKTRQLAVQEVLPMTWYYDFSVQWCDNR